MKYIADLHIHSKYAQATSKDLDLENLEKWAKIKGVSLLGTGDFTHPTWIQEIKSKLKDDGTGILRTASGFPFVLQTEISLVYTQGGKGRRIHHIAYAPNLEVVDQITEYLLTKGRIDYDGRPIFGINSIDFAEKLHEISPDTEVVPAHAWTSWFGLLGSKSGFDSVKECFQEKTHLIHSIETGMSSDPQMNWRISALDNITLTSNSDLHSFWPWRIGREANVFNMDKLSYKGILAAIRERKGFEETIEVSPSYGKYHFDGHRNCGVVMSPAESAKVKRICPVCRR
ncbi:DNA helicase UvrD, partial [Candidatus Woesearchaeota archaeon]|nr:DNA helicase UvrD [Candidatus Woesearchaeota archaeon]